MVVCVLVRNALSGKPDGGMEKLFGKPNEVRDDWRVVTSRAASRALAGLYRATRALARPLSGVSTVGGSVGGGARRCLRDHRDGSRFGYAGLVVTGFGRAVSVIQRKTVRGSSWKISRKYLPSGRWVFLAVTGAISALRKVKVSGFVALSQEVVIQPMNMS